MAAARTILYREALTPLLHRRFASAAFLTFFLCYLESIWLGDKSSFLWAWFPLGPAGIRAGLLSICALAVFVLNVASLHFGQRTCPSPFESFLSIASQSASYQVFGWYMFSAWFFGEIYMACAPASAGLGWVTREKAWERDQLNERALYLRIQFLLFGMVQSIFHLYFDRGQVRLPISMSLKESLDPQPRGFIAWLTPRLSLLKPVVAWDPHDFVASARQNILLRSAIVSFASPIIYGIFLRRLAWQWGLQFAASIWDVPETRLSYIPPHYPSLIFRSFGAGILLFLLWRVSLEMFAFYVGQQPIKKDQPLSSESKDPNGTLINGLKSKKEAVKTYALWDLALIVSNFPDRRKSLFTDIDRPSGTAWSQILNATLKNIQDVEGRIKTYLAPPAVDSSKQDIPIQQLPRISPPISHESILSNPPSPATSLEKVESTIATLAKSYGQSPKPFSPPSPFSSSKNSGTKSSTGSQKLLTNPTNLKQKLLTNASTSTDSTPPSSPTSLIKTWLLLVLRSRIGLPFRRTFPARVQAVILSSPISTLPILLCSIKALSNLAVASLKEDPYGRVAKDIPTLIHTFTGTIKAIEAFLANLPPHWTDVDFQEQDRRRSTEVEKLLACLRMGLGEMLDAFEPYMADLGIRESEIDAARKVLGLTKE